MQQARRHGSDFIDRGEKDLLVGFRGLGKSADLSDELKRCGVDFLIRDWRIEVKKSFDIAAHESKWYHLGILRWFPAGPLFFIPCVPPKPGL
jgi:hypothetical protein